MKLYYIPGACSIGPHIVLRELGRTFDLERVDVGTKLTETGRDFRGVNPSGSVPVLETAGGAILTEGPAIVQHLAEAQPGADLVARPGTLARARMQEVLNFTSSELRVAFGPLFNPALPAEARTAQIAEVGRKLDWLERLLSDGRRWLTGATYTVADPYAFGVVGFCHLHHIDLARWPHLQSFMARMLERPAVRAAMQAEGLAA